MITINASGFYEKNPFALHGFGLGGSWLIYRTTLVEVDQVKNNYVYYTKPVARATFDVLTNGNINK